MTKLVLHFTVVISIHVFLFYYTASDKLEKEAHAMFNPRIRLRRINRG